MFTWFLWLQRSPLTASPAHVNLQPGLGIIPTLFGLNNTSGEALIQMPALWYCCVWQSLLHVSSAFCFIYYCTT